MNIALWILAGGAAGWAGYVWLHANEQRGLMVSIIIGIAGGFLGGSMLAPLLGAADVANAFSLFSLVVALATAAGCLAMGNLLSDRYGI